MDSTRFVRIDEVHQDVVGVHWSVISELVMVFVLLSATCSYLITTKRGESKAVVNKRVMSLETASQAIAKREKAIIRFFTMFLLRKRSASNALSDLDSSNAKRGRMRKVTFSLTESVVEFDEEMPVSCRDWRHHDVFRLRDDAVISELESRGFNPAPGVPPSNDERKILRTYFALELRQRLRAFGVESEAAKNEEDNVMLGARVMLAECMWRRAQLQAMNACWPCELSREELDDQLHRRNIRCDLSQGSNEFLKIVALESHVQREMQDQICNIKVSPSQLRDGFIEQINSELHRRSKVDNVKRFFVEKSPAAAFESLFSLSRTKEDLLLLQETRSLTQFAE